MTAAVAAPAKVNLGLRVGAPRSDGFHPLESVFVRLGLADRLTLATAADDATEELEADMLVVAGPECGPLDGAALRDNLVLAALRLLRARVARPLPRLAITLEKRIPVAAGLGGGSSDAAAALRLGEETWRVGLDDRERGELAARLGSDVPFFAAGLPAALVTGRGEALEPLPGPPPDLGVLLAIARERLSTRAVFAAFDARAGGGVPGAGRRAHRDGDGVLGVVDWLRSGASASGLDGVLHDARDANDLWPAAASLSPPLADLRGWLEAALERPFLLSGSGPTLFTLYPSRRAADDAGRRLSSAVVGRVPDGTRELEGLTILATDLHAPGPAWRTP